MKTTGRVDWMANRHADATIGFPRDGGKKKRLPLENVIHVSVFAFQTLLLDSSSEYFDAGPLSTISPLHTLAGIEAHRKSPRLADNNETRVEGRLENVDYCIGVTGITVVNHSHCVLPESPSS